MAAPVLVRVTATSLSTLMQADGRLAVRAAAFKGSR